jgi:23S rRNA U2552 (ribose-2'-O)-methylase RlmE/FtsJ
MPQAASRQAPTDQTKPEEQANPDRMSSVRWMNRQYARTTETHATMIHFQKCYCTIQEMFNCERMMFTKYIPLRESSDVSFLDIACAPGGFSQYLLDHFPKSTGYGITLAQRLGGFPVAIGPTNRFRLCYFDLLAHPMGPEPQCPPIDIVIGDAQYFPRSQESIESYGGRKAGTVTAGRLGLLLREFILALRSLKGGGIFIFRFVVWEKVHSNIIRLFFLCHELFENVEAFKSEYQHTADCTFYCICSGFRRDVYLAKDIETHLRVAFARAVLSPPFAAVHNGTINCFQVVHDDLHRKPVSGTDDFPDVDGPALDKPDAHILESMYPFKKMKTHPYFSKTCEMFDYVYKMFLIGQASYTDHSTKIPRASTAFHL